jgi:predicted metalloprotease with PDZ domain
MLASLLALTAVSRGQTAPIQLSVDATQVNRYYVKVHETFPGLSGKTDIYLPKWLPGAHAPVGAIRNMINLHFHIGDQEIPWRRDDVEMSEFHVTVPEGSTQPLTADFVQAFDPHGTATVSLARISFFGLSLYPGGSTSDALTFQADVRLPDGWKYGTALPVESEDGQTVHFKPASLTTLVDSPIVSGKYFNKVMLSDQTPTVEFDMAGDSPESVQMPDSEVADFKRMLAEQLAIFGATHFRDYHFLLTFSDFGGNAGLEHSESSEDGMGATAIKSESDLAYLLCHEFSHSWNGKYRRPAGLATPNYDAPMKGELLWVYEGLTEYNGTKLSARAGLWTPEIYRDAIAEIAGYLDHEEGRTWRPLVDTAVGAPGVSPSWTNAGRTTGDYYFESVLIWLEAETKIMQLTNGQKSLDDFCHIFHGPPSTGPLIKPYTFDDVVAALNKVVAYDWAGFLRERIYRVPSNVPLGGIEQGGWKLVYNDTPPRWLRYVRGDTAGLRYTLGMAVSPDGDVQDLAPGMPAFDAGFAKGMRIRTVNGEKFSLETLKNLMAAKRPLTFAVENEGLQDTITVNYTEGLKFPHLERDPSKPDLLSQVISPHAVSK